MKLIFEDNSQDLTSVTANIGSSGIGAITSVSKACSPIVANMYVGKAIDAEDNQVGDLFNYADPKNGFLVTETKFKIIRIEYRSGTPTR